MQHSFNPISVGTPSSFPDYGLLAPCLGFTQTVARMNAKLGSDGRLTLSGWLLNQLDSPGFAWRTKNRRSLSEKPLQVPSPAAGMGDMPHEARNVWPARSGHPSAPPIEGPFYP